MTEKELYRKRQLLEIERKELEEKTQSLNQEILSLQQECPHSIVFQLTDTDPHKIGIIHTCYCPVCKKIERVYPTHEFEKTSFKDSKLVDLGSMAGHLFREVLQSIQEEFQENLEEIYSSTIAVEEIRERVLKRQNTVSKKVKK